VTYCPHSSLRMDGLYVVKDTAIAAAWTCTDCGTSGATMKYLVTEEQWAEAERIHRTGKREAT
jgi:hypothetical protein